MVRFRVRQYPLPVVRTGTVQTRGRDRPSPVLLSTLLQGSPVVKPFPHSSPRPAVPLRLEELEPRTTPSLTVVPQQFTTD